jgi:single-strand DNA-binding protein
MATATITIEGFAAKDSELKFTKSGRAVLEVVVPVTPQKKNDQGGWDDDGDTAWYRGALWGSMAENLVIPKGALVQIVGTLKPREYEHNGATKTSLDVTIKSIGILREPKGSTGSSGGYQRPTTQQTSQSDPWGGGGASQGGGYPGAPAEPPFTA